MSDDLVQWLRAQLDEDERIARGTGQPSLSWQNFDMDSELRDDVNAGTVAYTPREGTRAHIAAHDPARVLREIDAKRAIVDRYAEVADSDIDLPNDPEYAYANAYGEVVRQLATAYADRPGYLESWRP